MASSINGSAKVSRFPKESQTRQQPRRCNRSNIKKSRSCDRRKPRRCNRRKPRGDSSRRSTLAKQKPNVHREVTQWVEDQQGVVEAKNQSSNKLQQKQDQQTKHGADTSKHRGATTNTLQSAWRKGEKERIPNLDQGNKGRERENANTNICHQH